MEKSQLKKERRAKKAPLCVSSSLVMPNEVLPWERDLLAVLLEAVHGSTQQEEKSEPEVAS